MTYNTAKRNELISFFKRSEGRALTVDEICAAILTGGHGKSTVYRIIARLVDEGSLRRISDAKTRRITYQYVREGRCAEHLHLKCTDCGKLIHLSDDISHTLEKRILNTEGFELDSGALIYGRCESCIYARKGNTK